MTENLIELPVETRTETLSLTVLSKAACVQCRSTSRKLEREFISHECLDLTDSANLELAVSLGHAMAPVGVIYAADGQIVDHWSGFRPDKIDEYAARLPKQVPLAEAA